jgi:hypothetical protein
MPQMLREPANRFVFLGVAFLLFIMGCSAITLYWALDDELPLMGVTGTFRGWDKDNPNLARIEWTGQRNRYCDASVYHWIINNGKYVDFYETHRPGSIIMNEAEKGKPETIYETIEIPEEVRHNLVNPRYRIRFEFACNHLQKAFPLAIPVPELSLMPSEERIREPEGIERGTDSPTMP